MRALGFFYHLSLAVLFTTFTELLLGDFGGNFSKTAAFLGCVYICIYLYVYKYGS